MNDDEKQFARLALGRADSADVEKHKRSEEETIVSERTPLRKRVMNILEVEPRGADSVTTWTPEQRLALALIEIAGDFDQFYMYGCALHGDTCKGITFLKTWYVRIATVVGTIGVMASILLFILAVIGKVHIG